MAVTLRVYITGIGWVLIDGGSTFLGLADTFSSFVGLGGQMVLVNSAETALEAGGDPFTVADHLGIGDNSPHHIRYTDAEALAAIPDASVTVKGKVELATDAETQAGTDAVRAVTPAGLRADAPAIPAVDRIVRLDGDGVFISPGSVWRIGEVTLDLDFSTEYDTKAECNAVGLRFSDSDTPFPTQYIGYGLSGSWSHSSGNGWQPAASTDAEGPALLLPLMRQGNWELSVNVHHPSQTGSRCYYHVGAYQEGGHAGWYGRMFMIRPTSYYRAFLHTNDGDDTFSTVYSGTSATAAGYYTLGIRQKNGVIGVYDDQDKAWHNYATAFDSVGQAYPVTHLCIAIYKVAGYSIGTVYIRSIQLNYLL